MNKAIFFILVLSALMGNATSSPRLGISQLLAYPTENVNNLLGTDLSSYWIGDFGSWIAVQPERSVRDLWVTWNDYWATWSDSIAVTGACTIGNEYHPRDYVFLTSANSTNGQDGDWDTVETVLGNEVSARAHRIPFAGKTWLKFSLVNGRSALNELKLFDGDLLLDDSWFFLGNSITMGSFKIKTVDSTFSEQVQALDSRRDPAFVRGGISCVKSTDVVQDLAHYFEYAGNVKRWAIELGTNDMWQGGVEALPSFRASLQTLIDSAKAHGIEPIIARVMATDSLRAGWQVDPAYPATVDTLVALNGLLPGPDFDSWFRVHPEELGDDGVHTNEVGAASIQRLWAQVAATVAPYYPQVEPPVPSLPRVTRKRSYGDKPFVVDVAGRRHSLGKHDDVQRTGFLCHSSIPNLY